MTILFLYIHIQQATALGGNTECYNVNIMLLYSTGCTNNTNSPLYTNPVFDHISETQQAKHVGMQRLHLLSSESERSR